MAKLGRKITLGLIAVLLLTLILQGIFLYVAIRRYSRNEILRENIVLAESIASMLSDQPSLIKIKALQELLEMNQVQGAVTGPDHKILYTNIDDPNMRALIMRPEIVTARSSIYNGDGESIGHVIIVEHNRSIRRINGIFLISISISLCSGILAVFLIGAFLNKWVNKPLEKIINAIEKDAAIDQVDENWKRLSEVHNASKDARTRFYQEASHAMKGPLMNIQGSMEALEDGIFSQEEAVLKVSKEVNRLKTSADQMIRSSKAESYRNNPGKWKNFSMEDLLDEFQVGIPSHIELQRNIRQKDFTFDEEVIRIILDNLIQNAVRYARDKIVVSFERIGEGNILSVYNDGPPVDQELEGKLFQRFSKGDDGKTGLGLSIVKEYVEQTDGKIEYRYEDGPVFIINWPTVSH